MQGENECISYVQLGGALKLVSFLLEGQLQIIHLCMLEGTQSAQPLKIHRIGLLYSYGLIQSPECLRPRLYCIASNTAW